MTKEKLKKDGSISKQGEGAIGSGQPLKWNTPGELENSIKEYYIWSKENEMRITVTGLAWWLDTNRQTLINYENADNGSWLKRCNSEDRKGYVDTIKRAKRFIEMNYENSLFDKSSTVGAIFTLKNNYNWKDKQEIVTTTKETDISANDIDKQLKDLGVNVE